MLAGSSVQKDLGKPSSLLAFDLESGELLCSEPVFPAGDSTTSVHWATKTNQIYLGSSSGRMTVFYDESSRGGILKAANKAPKKQRVDETFFGDQMIFNPTEILEEKQQEWIK